MQTRMAVVSALALCLGLALGAAWAAPAHAAQDTVGWVQSAEGSVSVVCGVMVADGVKAEHPIKQDDIVRTGADGKVQVMFRDKTILKLAENSEVVVKDVYTAEGDGEFLMDFVKGTGRIMASDTATAHADKFAVQSPLGVIGIRGTEFGVIADPDRDVVALFEGGPVVYTNAQPLTPEAEAYVEVCTKLAGALKDAQMAKKMYCDSNDLIGASDMRRQIGKITDLMDEYKCPR